MMKISKDLWCIIISAVAFGLSFILQDISSVLLIIAYIIVSYEIFIKVIKNFGKGIIFDENFLMMIATIGAFIIGEWHEAVAVMLFYQIGEYMNDLGVEKSKKAIKDLVDVRCEVAIKLENNQEKVVNPSSLSVKDIIIVKPGDRIPVDGVVLEGNSNVDTSSITGEAVPRKVEKMSEVYSGYINLDGILKVEVTKEFKDSLVSRILKEIEESEIDKSNTEKFITKFAKIYTPLVVISALLLFIIPTLLLGGNINTWFYRSLIFLVASCPCALVLSIPLGYFCGIGASSRHGILVKSSNGLEKLSKMNLFAFDKTGTLTKGSFAIKSITPNKIRKNELLEITAHCEYYSNHPIAMSIKNAYKGKMDPKNISDFKEGNGGIKVKYKKDQIILGNYQFLSNNHIEVPKIIEDGTVIYVAKNNNYIGNIIIGDVIKDEAVEVINNLKEMNINNLAILSGDNIETVSIVAKKLGINQYYSDLKPLDKKNCIDKLKTNHKVCFIGDGINDAVVLLGADLGISMGHVGSDAAIEASDIVIMNDNLWNILKALKISNYTNKIVLENIVFALLVKLIVLSLGVVGISTIIMAVFADIGVTVITVLNSLRIMCKKV